MLDSENFNDVVFHPIDDQIGCLAHKPLASALNMAFPSDLGIIA